MNKLSQEDSLEMYNLLKNLKRNNWIVDIRDLKLFSDVWEFHYKITGYTCAYDGEEYMECNALMIGDLCKYFKQDIPYIRKKKCTKCRKSFPIEEFMSKSQCYECRNTCKKK